MQHPRATRVISLAATALLASSLIACSNNATRSPDPINVGLLVPMAGVYEEASTDIRDAFERYIEANHGKLGGHEVNVIVRDEGDETDPKQPKAAAKQLIEHDHADVILGGVASPGYLGAAPVIAKAKIPFVGIGGKPELDKDKADPSWLWQTSYDPFDTGKALAPYLADKVDGPVYAIGPDYRTTAPQHKLLLESFTKPFLDKGGELANSDGKVDWIPFPKTPKDLSSYFDKIADSGAKAIYTYNLGAPAVQFVKEWSKSKASDIPLYGAFLTEGSSLKSEGKAAEDVQTVMNYSPSIDNAANREFIAEWTATYPDRQTNTYNLTGWDSALVLDQAISSQGDHVSATDINKALTSLGTIESPRGSWQFSKEHTPVQRWYLRTVSYDGPQLINMVTENLATLGGD